MRNSLYVLSGSTRLANPVRRVNGKRIPCGDGLRRR